MNKKYSNTFILTSIIMFIFFLIKPLTIFDIISVSKFLEWIEFISFLIFIPTFFIILYDLKIKNKIDVNKIIYLKRFNNVLISQSKDSLFYNGDLEEESKEIIKEISTTLNIDRSSIWLYSNNKKTQIICQQLYTKKNDSYTQNIRIPTKKHESYFNALNNKITIIANNTETNPLTKSFYIEYLKPLGIKSTIDIPIIYNGDVKGVISIESFDKRSWKEEEINFVQVLSSLYSLAWSINKSNELNNRIKVKEQEIRNKMNAINKSNLVMELDLNGYVLNANDNFLLLTGYDKNEIIGKKFTTFTKIDNSFIWEKLMKGEYHSDKFEILKKNGDYIWIRATYNPILDVEGNIYKIMKIAVDINESVLQREEIEKKNIYLEHAAKIIRHDMHSGINTYLPRGISSLERRLPKEDIERLKLESPLKLLKEGLKHTQLVYKGVYEFTNLVKHNSELNKTECNIKEILYNYLSSTVYLSQVLLDDNLPIIQVNESLFCTAIDNLIRNGLKYNDSTNKIVKIYSENKYIVIEDNGRGLSQEDLDNYSKPYSRRKDQKESGTGLGLNICLAILKEHGFSITTEKVIPNGTKIKIKIYD
jgi:PAS domain S-box-containing protein